MEFIFFWALQWNKIINSTILSKNSSSIFLIKQKVSIFNFIFDNSIIPGFVYFLSQFTMSFLHSYSHCELFFNCYYSIPTSYTSDTSIFYHSYWPYPNSVSLWTLNGVFTFSSKLRDYWKMFIKIRNIFLF